VKLVNFGCGAVYHDDWINFDMLPCAPSVRRCNASGRLPLPDASVDVVYHSHMLEHLEVDEARAFLAECRRVLHPGGIMRVAVPDLEGIAKAYLGELAAAVRGDDATLYEWCRMELIDQAARSKSGGAMKPFLCSLTPEQLVAVRTRSRHEIDNILKSNPLNARIRRVTPGKLWLRLRRRLISIFALLLGGPKMMAVLNKGYFQQSGEVHRAMYDRFSLAHLLADCGFTDIIQVTAYKSRIPGYAQYGLDVVEGNVRKPDSLFMEAIRP
jgi:SAM-dependent methyltransferase